jgi:hypothetical protein
MLHDVDRDGRAVALDPDEDALAARNRPQEARLENDRLAGERRRRGRRA